jgi:endonuclease III
MTNFKNLRRVYKTFKTNYTPIPLETYGGHKYKTLVSTLLSSRTKDEVTLNACKRLFKKAPDIKSLNKLTQSEIKNLIYPVGFFKTKSGYLKKLANMLLTKHSGKIPSTREELMKLPGVGRKTANLVLNRAFNIPAIAVDTHVHKISNLLGWVDTKKPLETEKELVRLLPKRYWSETNRLFVSIGRQFNSQRNLINFLKENKLI